MTTTRSFRGFRVPAEVILWAVRWYLRCGVRVVGSFAASLDQDVAAVRAAPTLPWSSGQAEGQINRLKLLKRSMYGRAKLDLLRRRFLLAA